ncbi:hypothetical protein [Eisenibacter elegans]|jgi:uncharacterized membrane protein|uniref:hypothetical protein n=1 Tax=Eisenibacter elegans TaxID=997 RepID=UPI00040D3A9F|nr:hypothetical protein [Eisenibacter elegans]
MKKITSIFVVALVALASVVVAADGVFQLVFSTTDVSLQAGETSTVDLTISKSKSYQKAKVEVSTNKLPQGIEVSFEPTGDDQYKVIITAGAEVPAGTYSVMIQGKSLRENRAAILNVTVSTTTKAVGTGQ